MVEESRSTATVLDKLDKLDRGIEGSVRDLNSRAW